jgi:hypothetical protein
MSLQSRMSDLITAIGTDYKTMRTWLFGTSTGDLSGLTTTTKASIVAAINEVKASATGAPPSATETQAGVAQVATQAEVTAGTIDTDMLTPLKYRTDADLKYQAKAANLTALAGFTTSTDGTLAAASDTILASQKAVKSYADGLLDANNAYQYKGVIDCSANPNYPAASAGWTYKVSVAGKVGGASGVVVEVGDSLTCLVDASASGTQATVGANWIVSQTNIDGAVVGPATSAAGDFATFSGTTGKVVSDSGLSFDTDATLAAASATRVPSQSAVSGYLGTNYGNGNVDLVALYTTAKT